jgi:hypothetical protein
MSSVLIQTSVCFESYARIFPLSQQEVTSCLVIPASQIPLERVRFKGSPHFHANGTGYLDPVDGTRPWPEDMVLFGPPSQEIDNNWERLIGNRYFSVSEEEAKMAWGDKRHEYVDQRRGGYSAG